MIAVIDYGMGNLRSVSKALESLGAEVCVTGKPEAVSQAKKVVLPGVGAFPAAMRELRSRGLDSVIRQAVRSGKPYLGICLGLQLLFEESDEGGSKVRGLGLLSGQVAGFPTASGNPALKVPHMGWNQVKRRQQTTDTRHQTDGKKECPLLKDIPDKSYFYFVHAYYGVPKDAGVVALETEYGVRFASMVWKENLYATQFHPEKSQALGLKMLHNFIELP